MKNLKLSDLENISGGVNWYMFGKYILGTIVIAEIIYLHFKILGLLAEDYYNPDKAIICISKSRDAMLNSCNKLEYDY